MCQALTPDHDRPFHVSIAIGRLPVIPELLMINFD